MRQTEYFFHTISLHCAKPCLSLPSLLQSCGYRSHRNTLKCTRNRNPLKRGPHSVPYKHRKHNGAWYMLGHFPLISAPGRLSHPFLLTSTSPGTQSTTEKPSREISLAKRLTQASLKPGCHPWRFCPLSYFLRAAPHEHRACGDASLSQARCRPRRL